MEKNCCCKTKGKKLKVVNIGLQTFAESLRKQGVKVAQVNWRPPRKLDAEMATLLDDLL
ncbi:MAG: hypothetical protein J6B07_06200 [Opitutales bacterium]|nr:hypothetical protein [Opitutales bacterium]